MWSSWWKLLATRRFLPHGKSKVIWRRSYQTADLAHWTSKYMNYFLPCSFVSNICKLLYIRAGQEEHLMGEKNELKHYWLLLLKSLITGMQQKWMKGAAVREKGGDGVQREVASTKLVCERNGCLGCQLVTSASVMCVLKIIHNERSFRASSARGKITFYTYAYWHIKTN